MYNRGLALLDFVRYDEALACFAQALSLDPGYVPAHFTEALVRFAQGDYTVGLRKHERRFAVRSMRWGWTRPFAQPPWIGEADIAGKTILVHPEGGFGDVLQFCRYVPMLAAAGAHVILEVAPELARVMSSLAGVAQMITTGEPRPPSTSTAQS